MCGLGTWELLVILGIVVLLFGAKKLPALATGLGGALKAFKKSATGPDELEEPTPGADAPGDQGRKDRAAGDREGGKGGDGDGK